MKTVIIRSSNNTVPFSEVDSLKYYGIKHRTSTSVGFIAREKYKGGNYHAYCLDSLTDGNHLCTRNDISNHYNLSLLIKEFIENDFIVKEFDTYEEMFKWLLKKN